jgi:hypothetical protein
MTGTIATYYHWRDPGNDPILSKKSLHNNKPLYVCDDNFTWASPHIEGMELYEIDAIYEKPLILSDQFIAYETIFNDHNRLHQKFLKKGEFDVVIYTPHELSIGVRQIALLKPKDQVIAFRRVPDDQIDWKLIERQREDINHGWMKIMAGKKKGKNFMKSPYFTGKKVCLDGLTLYSAEDMERAIVKLGGEVCPQRVWADLIIYGKNSELAAAEDPYKVYPNAMVSWEGKIDDLLQELPDGIESLF